MTFGFCAAGFLINESFQSWADSPVKTTIETLPISDLKFPKVTVCPPKNTFTDLNYDVTMTENMTLKSEEEFQKYVTNLVENHVFLDEFDELEDNDKFYNWYNGYTWFYISPQYKKKGSYSYSTTYFLSTSSTSGTISTKYFGEKLKPHLVEKKIHYQVQIHAPESVSKSQNSTLHIKIEKMPIKGLNSGSTDSYIIERDSPPNATFYKAFSPPSPNGYRFISLKREINNEDLKIVNMDMMPGFKLSWWYSGVELKADRKYLDTALNQTKLFIRRWKGSC